MSFENVFLCRLKSSQREINFCLFLNITFPILKDLEDMSFLFSILSSKLFFLPSPSRPPDTLKLKPWHLHHPKPSCDGHQMTPGHPPSCTEKCLLTPSLSGPALIFGDFSISAGNRYEYLGLSVPLSPNLQVIILHHVSNTPLPKSYP